MTHSHLTRPGVLLAASLVFMIGIGSAAQSNIASAATAAPTAAATASGTQVPNNATPSPTAISNPLGQSVINAGNAIKVKQLTQFGLGRVSAVAWSPDGKTLALATGVGVRLYDKDNLTGLGHLLGSSDTQVLAWSPDSKSIASGGLDGVIRVWTGNTSQSPTMLSINPDKRFDPDITSMGWSPDGKTLAVGAVDRTIQLWNMKTQQLLGTLKGHTSEVDTIAWSPDSKTLASGSSDKTIRVWDANRQSLLRTLNSGLIFSLSWSSDNKTLAAAAFSDNRKKYVATVGRK